MVRSEETYIKFFDDNGFIICSKERFKADEFASEDQIAFVLKKKYV